MDPNLVLTVNVPALSLAARLLPDQAIRIARLFDGHRPLWAVLQESSLTPRMTVAVVSRLRSLGLLSPTSRVPSSAAVSVPPEDLRGTPVTGREADPVARALALAEHLDGGVDTVPERGSAACWADAIAQAGTTIEDEPDVVYQEPAHPPAPPSSVGEADPETGARVIVSPELMATEEPAPGPAPEAEAHPPEAFDAADENFFGSYQPEAPAEEFHDLASRPYASRLASRRRRMSDSWVKHIFGRLNLLAP
jgi:hypothetical protein